MFPNKLFLVLLLIAVGSVASQSIYDDAENILLDFVSAIQEAVDSAYQDFALLHERITSIKEETLIDTESIIGEIRAYMDEEVLGLRGEYNTKDPERVEFCVESSTDEILRLPESATQSITTCVNVFEEDARDVVEYARPNVLNSFSASDRLRADLDGCRILAVADERDCVARVSIEILLQTLEVPTEISEIVRLTRDTSGVYTQQIPFCLNDRVPATQRMADVILGSIRDCLHMD